MGITADERKLKNLLKDALVEVLEERPDLVSDAVAEAMEDMAMLRAVREGRDTDNVSRREICGILRKGRRRLPSRNLSLRTCSRLGA